MKEIKFTKLFKKTIGKTNNFAQKMKVVFNTKQTKKKRLSQ